MPKPKRKTAQSWSTFETRPTLPAAFIRQRKKSPTLLALEDLDLEVSDERFDRALTKFARALGGRYQEGKVRLPAAPYEINVGYMKLPDYTVAFFTQVPPRGQMGWAKATGETTSNFNRVLRGPIKGSKRGFEKYLYWLGEIAATIQQETLGSSEVGERMLRLRHKTTAPAPSAQRVASSWLAKTAGEALLRLPCCSTRTIETESYLPLSL